MKKIFLLIFCMICFSTVANALVVTYPASQNVVVDESSIFFLGKIDRMEKVYINDKLVIPSKSRAFSYFTTLKDGENIFAITKKDIWGNVETLQYKIIKDTSKKAKFVNEFVEAPSKYYVTTKNDVVLRNTPIDAGMNRLGYLPKDTKLVVDGVQNQFSRIYLAKDLYGWVKTSDVSVLPIIKEKTLSNNDEQVEKEEPEFVYTPNTILNSGKDKDNPEIYRVQVTNNTPYSLVSDGNKVTLSVYNLSRIGEIATKDFQMGKFGRYSLSMKDGVIDFILKPSPITKSNYSNKNVKVVIDAGHGGNEIGAVGCLGHKEKNINIEIAHKLKRLLEFHNFEVYMTREKDEFVSLQNRVDFAKSKDALIFISIHLNAVPISSNPALNTGTIVFYFNPVAKPLASELANEISKEIGTQNNGASQASFAVIRPTEYIGVLVELAYLCNPKDAPIYKSKFFAHRSAQGIYKGLVNYIQKTL